MGRKNGNSLQPGRNRFIRGNLPSDRELKAALGRPRSKAFGIRRPLEEGKQAVILGVLEALQSEDDIPAKLNVRKKHHVTLLSARAVGKRMMHGLVAGYELGQKSEEVKQQALQEPHSTELEVFRGEARIYQGYSLFVPIISPEIEDEISAIHATLNRHGIPGFNNKGSAMGLHMSLGETKQSDRMSKTEQRHVTHIVEEKLPPIDQPLSLQGWKVYP